MNELKMKKTHKCNNIVIVLIAAAPFKGMKQLLPSIARRVEAAKVAKASKELEEEGMKVYLCF
jgi:hypothetical protein